MNICNQGNYSEEWLRIADNLEIIYNVDLNYHPQHKEYKKGEKVKQADVILLGYPLQHQMEV